MFTTPCFIRKNTPELREKLEKLGYNPTQNGHGEWFIPMDELPYLETFPKSKSYMGRAGFWNSVIDCGTNEAMFLALAALRDDSDYMQWFVFVKTRTKRRPGCFGQIVGMDGHYQEIVGYEWYIHENNDNALITERLNAMIQVEVEDMEFLPHKATVEEIIEHFNKK